MKNRVGLLSFLLVLLCSVFIACSVNPANALKGEWVSDDGSYITLNGDGSADIGVYYEGEKVTLMELMGELTAGLKVTYSWSCDEVNLIIKINAEFEDASMNELFKDQLEAMNQELKMTYKLEGKTLTLITDGDSTVFTKK